MISSSSKNRYLITTSDERTWLTDRPVLFLGEWCKRYSRRKKWLLLDSITLPYHWNDSEQVYKDYIYLIDVYERALESISNALNNYHHVDHSIRYWRIILGPWLAYFIQVLFDRWQCIANAFDNYEINGYSCINTPIEYVIPQNMSDFINQYTGDIWNQYIYKEIIKYRMGKKYSPNIIEHSVTDIKKDPQFKLKFSLKSLVRAVITPLHDILKKSDNIFFISSHLPLHKQIQLELALGQFPALFLSYRYSPRVANVKLDMEQRNEININLNINSGFEEFMVDMIPKHIPALYLEGYNHLLDNITNISWPKSPKVIFTSNSFSEDDYFKMWCADKVENGSKLIVGQHGGLYGTAKYMFTEEHEIMISDRYLTWGWNDRDNNTVIPLSSATLLKNYKKLRRDPNGGALLVMPSLPRYSYHMHTCPIASQLLDFEDDQIRFAKLLNEDIRKRLVVRIKSDIHGWDQKERWSVNMPDISIDTRKNTFKESISQNRILICSYNATTFLETFAANLPTIMYWNPSYFDLRSSAILDYDNLRAVGILHDSPESAALHLNKIWENIEVWWNQDDVQSVLNDFTRKYARITDEWLNEWKFALQDVISQHDSH